MNEYQDQVMWWEVQIYLFPEGWAYFTDHGSRADAEEWMKQYGEMLPNDSFRIKRVTGLDD